MDGLEAAIELNLWQVVSETCGPITAIVVTYESAATIKDCVESLLTSDEISLIVVVDNASGDGTLEEVPVEPRVKKSQNERNLGFGAACNIGARAAETEFLLFVNPDSCIRAESVFELVTFLRHRMEAACCGPSICDQRGVFDPAARRGFPTPLNAIGRLFRLERVFPNSRSLSGYTMPWAGFDREMQVDSVLGACMLIRREDFVAVSGFDEDFFLFGEDLDLCFRFSRAGKEVWYVPTARLTHIGGASMAKAPRIARREFYRAMDIYWRKHRPQGWSRLLSGFVTAGIRFRAMLDRFIGH